MYGNSKSVLPCFLSKHKHLYLGRSVCQVVGFLSGILGVVFCQMYTNITFRVSWMLDFLAIFGGSWLLGCLHIWGALVVK